MTEQFSNTRLTIEQLPTLQGMHYEQLSPNYIKVIRIQLLAGLSIPLLALSLMIITLQQSFQGPFASPLAAIAALAIIVAGLAFMFFVGVREAKRKAFCMREHDIAFRHGLFFRKLVIQPLLRVQHVEVSQNPLEARWNLATVKLYSAGGFRYTFAIPGLPKPDADRIHQFVVSYQEAHHE